MSRSLAFAVALLAAAPLGAAQGGILARATQRAKQRIEEQVDRFEGPGG